MKLRKTQLKWLAGAMVMGLSLSSLPVIASESEVEIMTEAAENEKVRTSTSSASEAMNTKLTLYMEEVQEEADKMANDGQERNQADAITVEANGKRLLTGSIEEALEQIAEKGTITINKSISGQARIKKNQDVTIYIGAGVCWDNKAESVTQGSWQNSVIVNEGGELAVHSLGGVMADASKSQSFALYNMPGAVTKLYGGLYTSRHGDYILLNEGTMELNHGVVISKPIAGSHSAVLNGFRWDNPGVNPQAQLTINGAMIHAPFGIALKNDTYGEAKVYTGFLAGKNCPIQNIHQLEVHGGDFYTIAPNGYGIYNSPFKGQTPEENDMAQGHVGIHGGNFYSSSILHLDTSILALKGEHPDSCKEEDHSCIRVTGGTFWNNQPSIGENIVDGYELIPHTYIGHRWQVVKKSSQTITPEMPDQEQTPEEDSGQAPSVPSTPDVPSNPSQPSNPGSAGAGSGSGSGSHRPSKPGSMDTEGEDVNSIRMFRRYNPNSGEHFHTADLKEAQMLLDAGWKDEGTGWMAPSKSSAPVFRLYNPNAGDHHFTTSKEEADHLVSLGWKDEGIGWYSAEEKTGLPLYRQYNPNAKAGAHNYTTDTIEKDYLISVGWKDESIGWYALDSQLK